MRALHQRYSVSSIYVHAAAARRVHVFSWRYTRDARDAPRRSIRSHQPLPLRLQCNLARGVGVMCHPCDVRTLKRWWSILKHYLYFCMNKAVVVLQPLIIIGILEQVYYCAPAFAVHGLQLYIQL